MSKHNLNKRYRRTALATLRQFGAVVAYITGGDGAVVMLDRKRIRHIAAGPQMQRAISTIPHEWSILIAGFGLDYEGKTYMKSEIIQASAPYYHTDLIDVLNEKHDALLKTIPDHRRIGAGWLADPTGQDMDTDTAFKLFELIGVNEL